MSKHIVYKDNKVEVVVGYDKAYHILFAHVNAFNKHISEPSICSETLNDHNFPEACNKLLDFIREHGSVNHMIWESIMKCMSGEMSGASNDRQCIDWTKGIPFGVP